MKRARGAALIAAMLVVALVATFAAAATWQQWRGVEVEEAERDRVQSGWILTGALDWARLILREDARAGGTDHLAEPWAVPLQEARLSSFLAVDGSDASAGGERDAFLSGQIVDLQSRLNLRNLVEGGQVSTTALQAFEKLFGLLGLPAGELQRMAENMRFAVDISADNRSGAFAPLPPADMRQLTWLGVSPETAAALAPHVVLLPARTPLNLNTAGALAIAASVPGLDLASAQRLVAQRDGAHFRNVAAAASAAGSAGTGFNEGDHSVGTRFFEVRGRLRIARLVLEERSLVQRNGLDVVVLARERGSVTISPPIAVAGR